MGDQVSGPRSGLVLLATLVVSVALSVLYLVSL
jgi:hypothetical protein